VSVTQVAGTIPRGPSHPLRHLIRQLAAATDSQVLRIIATVETAADRREAEILLSPLRPRLNVLRPPRRLRIRRLMFYPLDPVILPPRRWRPGRPAIPRSILTPLATTVATAIPASIAQAEALLAGQTTANKALIRAAGSVIWPATAAALDAVAKPAAWSDTGLAVAHYHALAPILAALLRQASALETLILTALPGMLPPSADAVHAILRAVEQDHPPALPTLFLLLMMRLPEPAVLFSLSRRDPTTRGLAAARADAVAFLLERIEREGAAAWIAGGPLAEAAETVRRLLELLMLIDQRGSAAMHPTCLALRQALDLACRRRVEVAVQSDLLPALSHRPVEPEALETMTLGLALFHAEAREVGGKQFYDTMLGRLMATIRQHTQPPLAARLIEILLGTDAALAMLD